MGFLPNIGVPELLIILVIVVFVFGPKRIPAAAKSVSQGFKNFRASVRGGDEEEKAEIDEKTKTEV